MLLKITRKNLLGEEKETVIQTDRIVTIKDKHVEPIKLYDEDGNVVETKEAEKVYEIILDGAPRIFVKEKQYSELLKALNVK